MKKHLSLPFLRLILLLLWAMGGAKIFAQVPVISYTTPQSYTVNTAITPLTPTSSGVGAPGLSNSAVTIGTGFNKPIGVAVDAAGNVYVADTFNNQVVEIPDGGGSAITIGTGFRSPIAVAADASGNVYVGDAYGQIKEIPAGGGTPYVIGSNTFFGQIYGLSVDAIGNVYVADAEGPNLGTSAIYEIPLGSSSANLVYNTGFGVNSLTGFTMDAAGNFYVVDQNNNAVSKVPVSNGVVGTPVTIGSGFLNPFGVAVDVSGNVFVSDIGHNAVKEILANGGSTITVASGFNNPLGIATDAAGNSYVADQKNNAIKEIKQVGGYYISPALPAGLAFNNTTGVISGTPQSASPATSYTVTAYNSTGATTATFSLAVKNIPAPVLSYASPQNYTINSPITSLKPVNSGGAVAAVVQAGTVTTFAGGGTQGTVNGLGTAVRFTSPYGLTTDAYGNVYVADYNANLIRKITPFGLVTTFAGGGAAGSFSNGTGTAAGFDEPKGVVADAAGNLFVTDASNNMIRKITPAGVVTTFVNGLSAGIYYPSYIAIDGLGNLYVTDQLAHKVYKITSAGAVSVLAGSLNGSPGSSNGVGTAASFNSPMGIVADAAGNLYVADSGNGLIRKITPNGTVTTVAASTSFDNPTGMAIDPAGNLYVGEQYRIREITPAGVVSVIAGTGSFSLGVTNGVGTAASFQQVNGLVYFAGSLYASDFGNAVIRKIVINSGYSISPVLPAGLSFDNTTGIISGTPTALSPVTAYTVTAYSSSGIGTATVNIGVNVPVIGLPTLSYAVPQAYNINTAITPLVPTSSNVIGTSNATVGVGSGFSYPLGAAVDGAGNVYVADYGNRSVKKIPAGGGTPVAIGTGFSQPQGVAVDAAGNVYVADYTKSVIVEIPAGGGSQISLGSGFYHPYGVAVDAADNLYVADMGNKAIKKIAAGNGAVSTLASGFNSPQGVAVDAAGNVYVADPPSNYIKMIPAGGGAIVKIGASLNTNGSAQGVAVDGSGNVYVSIFNWVTKIPAGGGTAINLGTGLNQPYGVAIDASGNVFVADYGNNAIKEIKPVSGYTISPALPAGLNFSNTTGIISGTPTALSAATNYTVTAYNSNGSTSATLSLAVIYPKAVISSFSPTSGGVGSLVTVTGTNLTNPTAFYIGGKPAIIISNTGTKLVGMVMPGAVSGAVSVTNTGGTTNGGTFSIIPLPLPSTTGQEFGTPYDAQEYNRYNIQSDARFGSAIAVSADGSISVIGGPGDNFGYGAVWIYNNYEQTTAKLQFIPPGQQSLVYPANQGTSVGISADGTNIIVGAPSGNGSDVGGTVLLYTNPNNSWVTRQISPVNQIGNPPNWGGSNASQSVGSSVAISADGNTVIWGVPTANGGVGAASVSTKIGNTWYSQVLTPTGNSGNSGFGSNVTLSADGYTALVGGPNDNGGQGAAWVFIRTDSAWSQQGNKLVSSTGTNTDNMGSSCALSADGNTGIVLAGTSAYVFIRSANAWSQQGNKLAFPTGYSAGGSVCLSADGNRATIGFYLFIRNGNTWTTNLPQDFYVPRYNSSFDQPSVYTNPANQWYIGAGSALSADGSTLLEGVPGLLYYPNGNAQGGYNQSGYVQSGDVFSFKTAFAPTIASFTPTSASSGTTVTINGGHLSGITSVSFGGIAAIVSNIVSDSQITAIVGTGATGSVSVTTGGGTASLGGFTFAGPPNIKYTTPQTFAPGKAITALTPSNTGGAVPVATYGQVSTFAGSGTAGNNNATGIAASFKSPAGLTSDASGNIYVADRDNNLIRKITPLGVVSTVGGTSGGQLSGPTGVAVDGAGNIYVADRGNNVIRKITPQGVLSTFAGTYTKGSTNGSGTSASFYYPAGIAIDASGYLYVADQGNNLIRKISPLGVVSTLAGSGLAGSANGTGVSASFNSPTGIIVDNSGNVYVTDSFSNKIREISPGGVVTTVAGSGATGSADGISTAASFNIPAGITIDVSGNLFVTDQVGQRVRKITPDGTVSTLAGSQTIGSANGIGTSASFNSPFGITADGLGNLFVADYLNNLIRKITVTGYTISPALPAGLNFTSTTGIISGTPTAITAATDYTVTAYNQYGSGTATVNITVNSSSTGPVTSSTVLTNLSISTADKMNGAFVNGVWTISTTVNPSVTSASFTPITLDPKAKVTINGIAVADSTASALIPLNTNAVTNITLVVTSSDGTAQKVYPVVVNHGASSNTILNGLSASNSTQLTGTSVNGLWTFTGTAGTSVNSLTFTPVTADPNAKVTINGIAVADNTASAAIALNANATTKITLVVTAADGVTTQTYPIVINRGGASSNTALTNLTVSTMDALTGAEVNGLWTMSATVLQSVSNLSFTPTTANAGATVTINGIAVANGAASAPFTLNATGSTTFTMVVTAADGITQQIYPITINKSTVSSNTALTGLLANNGVSLSGAEVNGYWTISGTAGASVSSLSFTPTTADPNAKVTINGTAVADKTASSAIAINASGTTNITLIVTASDGVTKQTYPIVITKLGTNASLRITNVLPDIFKTDSTVVANNILSPNGDGVNDTWTVRNIDLYPNNSVTVYDRIGHVVFTKKGYANDWAGTYGGSVLNQGTYYYLLDLGNGTLLKGFITVVRDR